MGNFDESKHPRAEDGKFTTKGAGSRSMPDIEPPHEQKTFNSPLDMIKDNEIVKTFKSPSPKNVADKVSKKMKNLDSKLSDYREGFLKFIEDGILDENELNILSNTLEDISFIVGDPSIIDVTSFLEYDDGTVAIGIIPDKQHALDIELGYAGSPRTIFHEYGHFLDWYYGDLYKQKDFVEAYHKDALPLLNRLLLEIPNTPRVTSLESITDEQASAIKQGIINMFGLDPEDSSQKEDMKQRLAFLSDFIGCLTNNNELKFFAFDTGIFGHNDDEYDYDLLGSEPWAEYVAMRMTKDSEGLKLYKAFLPNVYEQFEKVYNTLGRKKKNGKR